MWSGLVQKGSLIATTYKYKLEYNGCTILSNYNIHKSFSLQLETSCGKSMIGNNF